MYFNVIDKIHANSWAEELVKITLRNPGQMMTG